MKTIHYPNTLRSHLVTIVPTAPFTPKSTSKLRSALHFSYSIVTFDYNHYVYSDYLVCTVTAIIGIVLMRIFLTNQNEQNVKYFYVINLNLVY